MICGRGGIRHPRTFTVISRISSVLVSRTEAPLVVSNGNSGSASLCTGTSTFTGALGIRHFTRLSTGRSVRRCCGRGSVSCIISRGRGATALARDNIGGTRRFFNVRGLASPSGLAVRRRMGRTVGTGNIVGLSISCIIGSNRIVVISRFANHLVCNHHFGRNLRRTVRTGRNMGIRDRDGALTAVAFRGCFHLCGGLSNVANATRARSRRFRRVCGLSIIRVPAGGPILEGSLPSSICGARGNGFRTIVSTVIRTRRGKRPILINAVSVRGSRLLSGVLGGENVGRGILGTGRRRGRTRVITRTNGLNTMAVTAGVTNHNASVVLNNGTRCVTGTTVHGRNFARRLVRRTANCTRASSRRVVGTEGAFERLGSGCGRRVGNRTRGMERTKNLCVVNARERRSHHVSGRLHNHTNHRNSPNIDHFFLSARSSLVHLFNNSEVGVVVRHVGITRSVPVRGGVLADVVRNSRRGIRLHGFNVHGSILRCSSIVGGRHRVVCNRHSRILGNRSLRRAVLGVIRSAVTASVGRCLPRNPTRR